jgi:hypothetical protein
MQGRIAMALDRIQKAVWRSADFDCRQAEEVMSAFIDSMASDEESLRLEAHVGTCAPCLRQLQGYLSLRRFVAGVAAPAAPPDLALETRIRLSHTRSNDFLGQFSIRCDNVLKPLAIPALSGTFASFLCFALLLSSFGASLGRPVDQDDVTLWVYTQPRAADPLITQIAALGLDDLTVDLNIDQKGKAFGKLILTGPDDPVVTRWLKDVMLLAEFHPARVSGRPVPSRLILSFIGVKS